MSSRHAEIEIKGDEVTVTDLGSSNGTFINGVRLEGSKPNKVTASDDIQFGSSRIAIEIRRKDEPVKPAPPTRKMDAVEAPPKREEKAPPKPPSAPAAPPKAAAKPQASAKAAEPEKEGGGMAWTARYWVAGAIALMAVMLLMFFVEYYADSQDQGIRLANRYKNLASQYVHILGEEDVRVVPTPVTDRSLLTPFRILNAEGEILYPESLSVDEEGNPQIFAPLIDPKTSKVRDRAKAGLS